ncbi:poly-gamma-glutamate system protein [Candidatus Bipolaricaulota bacterium]|nr:poly-gamma-glutamate system protein [Candidatus Bipolaricaulota bacterium]
MKKLLESFKSGKKKFTELRIKIKKRYIYIAAGLSILTLLVVFHLPINNSVTVPRGEMLSAAEKMEEAINAVRNYREKAGLPMNRTVDPNLTGLIGKERSELTTTLGDLEAKRTTTNPNFAGLMVLLMKEAGVTEAETVAIGASGSFPGAIIATVSAVEAIGARPVIIYSLGSSMWGGNLEELTILEIHDLLRRRGVISSKVEAASLGGQGDVAADMAGKTRKQLVRKIRDSEASLILGTSLRDSVMERMEVYRRQSRGKIGAFVNIGGAAANMGTSATILKLKPGINRPKKLPPKEKQGVIYSMAAEEVPVIHVLNIKGLALRYQLTWDPVPLPAPGEGEIFDERANKPVLFWLVFAGYFGVLAPGLGFIYRIQS